MPEQNGCSINAIRSDESEDTDCLIEKNTGPVLHRCCPIRLQLATLMFFGFAVVYALRVNFSVAMVAMVNTSDSKRVLNHSVVRACPLPSQYLWDPETQGWLLGGFFFGYLCTQIPGGYLSGHYGGRLFLGLGVLCTAVLTLLTPLAAQLGPTWLFVLRALEGFGEGVTFPAMMALWTRWAPPLERSRLMTFSGSGANFGAFVALPLTGYICQTLGWPAVFYIPVIHSSQHTLAGWRKVFWVAALINVVGAVIFTIFGSGNVQPWALKMLIIAKVLSPVFFLFCLFLLSLVLPSILEIGGMTRKERTEVALQNR